MHYAKSPIVKRYRGSDFYALIQLERLNSQLTDTRPIGYLVYPTS